VHKKERIKIKSAAIGTLSQGVGEIKLNFKP
jgi:hypothetical protein